MEQEEPNNKRNKPTLAFAIGISTAVLMVAQLICEYLGLSLPVNIAVDIISVILSMLVTQKVLSCDKDSDESNMTETIKSDIHSKLDEMNIKLKSSEKNTACQDNNEKE